MRVFLAAAVIALLAGPACAQSHVPEYGETDKAKTPQQIEAEKAAQEAYKRSLGNIPDQGAADPWGNVRTESAPRPVAKASAAKRTKTVNTAK